MQTLNIFESQNLAFNSFRTFDNTDYESSQRNFALLEQLQTTLELDKLLNIFAMEASKIVDFSGLYFQKSELKVAVRGSKPGKTERQFELKIHDKFLGILTYAVNSPISLNNYKKLNELHEHLIYPINNAIQYQKAMNLAMQDSLTNLGNRRYFDEQVKRAMNHANRHQKQVGLIVADLNKFKQINDTFGHHVGDEILINFGAVLKSCIRDSDSVFRFGGDEFAVLVEDASNESLSHIESRIHHSVCKDFLLAKYQVSCSLGSTFMTRADTETTLFERADQALYKNKMNMPNKLSLV